MNSAVKVKDGVLSDGSCPNCGRQCYKITSVRKFGVRRNHKEPLNIKGQVHNGECLACHPSHQENENTVNSATPAYLEPAKSTDKMDSLIETLENPEGTQKETFRVLCELRNLSSTESAVVCFSEKQDIIKAVLTAIKKYESDSVMQEQACALFRNLTIKGIKIEDTDDAIVSVIYAMGNHQHVSLIQQHGCATLRSLARNIQCRSAIGKEGGVEAILNGMQCHVQDASVQILACGALTNLSIKSATNKSHICNNNGIPAVLYAMERHPNDSGVQEKACVLLHNLSQSSVALPLIKREEMAEKLLTAARTKFPLVCEENAKSVLVRL